MEYSVVIVAAGKGTRMNLGYNKVYYKINDKTILENTISIFLNDIRCKQIIVVCDIQDYVDNIGFNNGKILLACGGKTRQESVFNGLKAVISDVVLIHDGARPYLDLKVVDRILYAMENNFACCPLVKVKDTIKIVKNGYIEATVDREILRHAQTPQAFNTEKLFECFKNAFNDNFIGTDDCSIFEKYSKEKIVEVEGDYNNIKITTIEDIGGFYE
ncbi:MAG: 2-C-methyl-D-erythritol 4-phosphate cytidylyltransferase [Erysipelotrichaceae bacterium]|nr:2-C-methyl-D-erythritol 4-phosphate cytidylyltransferase [Erysipelotrichaceae bacterium]